jgi:hypothetical protein
MIIYKSTKKNYHPKYHIINPIAYINCIGINITDSIK